MYENILFDCTATFCNIELFMIDCRPSGEIPDLYFS